MTDSITRAAGFNIEENTCLAVQTGVEVGNVARALGESRIHQG